MQKHLPQPGGEGNVCVCLLSDTLHVLLCSHLPTDACLLPNLLHGSVRELAELIAGGRLLLHVLAELAHQLIQHCWQGLLHERCGPGVGGGSQV